MVRLYGPWQVRVPRDAANFFSEYSGRWWVAGGWAIDAFTGTARPHDDLDIAIPRSEAEGFVDFVGTNLDVWAAAGSLTPLLPDGSSVPKSCGNLWLRASGADPRKYDVLLEDVREQTWVYKRFPHITRPLSECLWASNGITYLRQEIQLLFKAKHARPKDTFDFERCLPKLGEASRIWLAQSLRQQDPRHPWIDEMTPTGEATSSKSE